MEKIEFLQVFQELCLAFRMPLDEKTTMVYYKYLKEFTINEFKQAIANIITDIKYEYFPRVSMIYKECKLAKAKGLNQQKQKLITQADTFEKCDILEFFKKDD